MDEQTDQVEVEVEVIEIYESSSKKWFLKGTADVFIIVKNLKIELREIIWSIAKDSKKISVSLPGVFKNTKIEDKTVVKYRRIIKFEPENVHSIIHQSVADAIKKDVEDLYKNEIEQHRQDLEKQQQEAEQDK